MKWSGISYLLHMQGVVEARHLEDNVGQRYCLVLLSRRSGLHPGMRYIARGLNALASPGNEIECEQVRAEHALFTPLLMLCDPGCRRLSAQNMESPTESPGARSVSRPQNITYNCYRTRNIT